MMHTSVIDFDTCGQLIHASQDRLYRYCYVKNEHDALDIVGEATYKALVSLHTLQRADRFDAWMTSLVIHTALDWLRKNRRLVPTEHEVLDIIPAHEPDLTPEEQMDLYRLLDSLPTEERTYLILHYFEERSFPEMAEILSMPEAKLKSRFYRILHRLRAHLKEESL